MNENVQLAVGNVRGPCNEEQEVTSTIKAQDRVEDILGVDDPKVGRSKGKKGSRCVQELYLQ